MSHGTGRTKDNACDGKRVYLTASEARKVVREMKARKGQRRSKLSVYRCPFCKNWHVGNSADYAHEILVVEYGETSWKATCFDQNGLPVAEFVSHTREAAYYQAITHVRKEKA